MRAILFCAVAVTMFGICRAEDKATEASVQIGELNEAYVTAFNKQDAKAVAACCSSEADYTLLTGDTINGAEKIEAAHASFFNNNPGAKIKGKQQTYRMVRPNLVLASGVWEVADGPSEYPSSGLWFTVVVKKGGKWRYEAMRLMAVPQQR